MNSTNDSGGELCPGEWNVFDVAQFLRVNDCANYCDAFSKQVSNYSLEFRSKSRDKGRDTQLHDKNIPKDQMLSLSLSNIIRNESSCVTCFTF